MRRAARLTASLVLAACLGWAVPALANCSLISGNIARTPDANLTDNGNQTVTHATTGLMWKQCVQGLSGAGCTTGTATPLSWAAALRAAVADTTGSHTDWRLPSRTELLSIVETACSTPAINSTLFPLTPGNGMFWTSTPLSSGLGDRAWAIDFATGSGSSQTKPTTNLVRLVRLGTSTTPTSHDTYNRSSSVATGPTPFSFTAQTAVNRNSQFESNIVTLAGITGTPAISVTGGEYRINSGTYTTGAGTVANGNTVQLRMMSSSLANTLKTATLTINGLSFVFAVTTGTASEPDEFAFTHLSGLATNVAVTSNTITLSGLTAARNISISGGTTPLFSINGGAFTSTPTTVSNGQTVAVRHTTSASTSTAATTTLNINGKLFPFTATTGATATEPAALVIPSKTGVAPSTATDSATVVVTGITTGKNISIAGTGAFYSLNGGAFINTAGTGTVTNNSTLVVRGTSSATALATATVTVTINALPFTFDIVTRATVVEPNDIAFTAVGNATRSDSIASNIAQVTGITVATRAISITGGEYRISTDGITWGAWTAGAGTIANNNYVQVRQTSSASASTTTTANLTINARVFPFAVTTGAALDPPVMASFEEQYGIAALGTAQSETLTVTGITGATATTSIVPTASYATYSITGGAYASAASTIANNGTLAVRMTMPNCAYSPRTATLLVNGYSYPFTAWTGAGPAGPTFAGFTSLTGQTRDAVVQSAAAPAVSALAVSPSCIAIWGQGNPEYQIGAGAWTNATAVTVANTNTVRVRLTAASTSNTTRTLWLLINGQVYPFSVTTQ